MSPKPISPEALRRYIQDHQEKHYLLVDVRQPQEYRQGHIPGASLIPLPQLVQDMDQLPADKELIFYCHVGGRSMAAAAMVEEDGREGPIYNLTGGIAAWDGERVPDMPRLKLFAGQSTPEVFRSWRISTPCTTPWWAISWKAAPRWGRSWASCGISATILS